MSRQLERTASAWRRWKRALATGETQEDDPFVWTRSVTTRGAFRSASELGDSDPLCQPLRRWVYRLLEQRINRDHLVEVRRRGALQTHAVDQPVRGAWSLSEMLRRAVAEPDRREAWLGTWGALTASLSDAIVMLWERRLAVARGLGLEHPDAIEAPGDGLAQVAESWLRQSADLWDVLHVHSLPRWFQQASGEAAAEGWPARVTLRSVAGLLGEGHWLERVALDPGRMPPSLGPTSYLRALARLGASWADGLAPADLPFVIAHDPYGLRRRVVGALFGTLPLNPEFTRRRLSVPAFRRTAHQRALAGVVLAESRRAALSVLLRAALLRDPLRAPEELTALSRSALGVTFQPEWCGALVRLHVDTQQRFAALLLVARELEELTDSHDVDWFRNPRAIEQLRADTHRSPPTRVSTEALEEGKQALLRWLGRLLG